MTFYLQYYQKNRQGVFYENTPLIEIKQLENNFLSEDGLVFKKLEPNNKNGTVCWTIEDPFGKIFNISRNKLFKFAENLNLSATLLTRNFNRGIKIKNTYNIIDANKITHKKVNIKNNSLKRYKLDYLMVSNFLDYDKNNKLLKIIHIDENQDNNSIKNLKLIPLLENGEKIKEVKEFEGCYATTTGRIFKDIGLDFLQESAKSINRQGYELISTGKGRKNMFIHRLVAMAFLENNNNLPEINHINEIKDDNRLENLEWVTKEQNLNHSRYKLGRGRSIYTIKNVETDETFKTTNLNEFSEEKNLSPKLLRKTYSRSTRKGHKGYKIIERILLKDLN
jgi:hypothetical protein